MAGKVPSHKWLDQKACSDYLVSSQADLRPYFSKNPYRIHKGDYQVDMVAQMILRGLGHDDLPYHGDISIRDSRNFRVETVMILAKRLAEYICMPIRYGNDPRNVIASSLNVFAHRIKRYRYGHDLPEKPIRMISKHELGLLTKKILSTEYLWDIAFRYETNHRYRVKRGICEPLYPID